MQGPGLKQPQKEVIVRNVLLCPEPLLANSPFLSETPGYSQVPRWIFTPLPLPRTGFTGTPEPEERDYFSAVPSYSFICSASTNVLIAGGSLNAMETPGHIVRSSASTFFILGFLFKNGF